MEGFKPGFPLKSSQAPHLQAAPCCLGQHRPAASQPRGETPPLPSSPPPHVLVLSPSSCRAVRWPSRHRWSSLRDLLRAPPSAPASYLTVSALLDPEKSSLHVAANLSGLLQLQTARAVWQDFTQWGSLARSWNSQPPGMSLPAARGDNL